MNNDTDMNNTDMNNTDITDINIIETIEKCARGVYQRNIIRNIESWSGAGLSGAARDWSMKYKYSRENLFNRLVEKCVNVGVYPTIIKMKSGKLLLAFETENITYTMNHNFTALVKIS